MAVARNPKIPFLAALVFVLLATSVCEGRQMKDGRRLAMDASKGLTTDAFRPTSPGVSPGAGHSFQGSMNPAPKSQGHGVQFDLTGSSQNDFRPTDPGHSPGDGHK